MGGTKLGDIFPNAAVKTTEGKFNFKGTLAIRLLLTESGDRAKYR